MSLVKPPTPEEFKKRLEEIRNDYRNDQEDCHAYMDEYILEVLETLGYNEGVRIFRTTPKWYA